MFKLIIMLTLVTVRAQDIEQIKALGEQIEGCPKGCDCIIDASRENRAKRKLGEFEEDTKGKSEETREIKTRTK